MEKFDGISTQLRGFLDQLDTYFRMKPATYPNADFEGRILRCTGAAMNWFTAMKNTRWMSYEHWKTEFCRNFDDPHSKDSAIRKIEVAVQKTNQKTAEFVAYIRKLQLEADLPADQLWAFLWSAVPTLVREYLTRTRNYAKRTGPPTVEGCFQDILSAGKQVEESAEDEKK